MDRQTDTIANMKIRLLCWLGIICCFLKICVWTSATMLCYVIQLCLCSFLSSIPLLVCDEHIYTRQPLHLGRESTLLQIFYFFCLLSLVCGVTIVSKKGHVIHMLWTWKSSWIKSFSTWCPFRFMSCTIVHRHYHHSCTFC